MLHQRFHTIVVLVVAAVINLAAGLQGGRVDLDVSAQGRTLVRRVSRQQHKASESPADDDLQSDGSVTVINPPTSQSEILKLEELTEECMQEKPTADCMERYGSYGVRKMFTETFENAELMKWVRPGWMAHPEVQKKKILELTLPGSVNAGSYAITGEDATAASGESFGLVSQNMDLYEQLMMGVRVFDIRVAYSAEQSLVYMSHGALMVPLATALKDISRFLFEHMREVVILDVIKDPNADKVRLTPLLDEEESHVRVPGQLVHEAISCELKELLVTYKTLNKLPLSESPENPTVGALTDIGARVLYFWHGQQVLCNSFQECTQTPGWYPPAKGSSFGFGPPFPMGKRLNATGGRETARIIEPDCIARSNFFTKADTPEELIKKLKFYVGDMHAKVMETRPECYPYGVQLPDAHAPTIFYTVDGYAQLSMEDQQRQMDKMRGVKAIYTRGEGFTARTDAERTNYLILAWFLKKDNQEQYLKPNALMAEYSGASYMSAIRMIEANQGRPDCGWAVYCKESGSCWSDTMLGEEDNCLEEKDVLQKLKDHVDGVKKESRFWEQAGKCLGGLLALYVLGTTLQWCMHHTNEEEKPKTAGDKGLEESAAATQEEYHSDTDSIPSNQRPEGEVEESGGLFASVVGSDIADAAPGAGQVGGLFSSISGAIPGVAADAPAAAASAGAPQTAAASPAPETVPLAPAAPAAQSAPAAEGTPAPAEDDDDDAAP